MENIRQALSDKSVKTVIAGIGNLLRNDDGVGPYIAGQIHEKPNRIVLIPETGIERYISAINRRSPDLIIFIDCVDFGMQPGHWEMIPAEKIYETTCHSHNISLKMLTRFFYANILVIGIQPDNIEVGEVISQPVMAAAREIIALINEF